MSDFDRHDIARLLENCRELNRAEIVLLAACALLISIRRRAERRAFQRWLVISWALFRRRTFVVVGSGDAPLPAPRIIGGLD